MIKIPKNREIRLCVSVSWWLSGDMRAGVRTFCLICLMLPLLSCSKAPVYPEAPRAGEYLVVDVSSLSTEIPEYFTYHHNGKNVNFFVIKIGDSVFSFLDACAVCYPQRKGFSFDKGYFVCRACNVRYSVTQIEKGIGGCFPIRISGDLRDRNYFIAASTLQDAADKF